MRQPLGRAGHFWRIWPIITPKPITMPMLPSVLPKPVVMDLMTAGRRHAADDAGERRRDDQRQKA